jgi:TolB-like protein
MPPQLGFGWRGRLAAALLLVAVIAVTWNVARLTSYPTLPQPLAYTDSVAFMPVENLTADSALGRLGDALTYGVINWLEKIPALKLPGYTSVRSFDGGSIDLRQLASSLGVRLIVTSRFRRVGSGVRLEAELVEAASGQQVISERWPVDVRDEEQAERDLVGRLADMVAVGTGLSAEPRPLATGASPAHVAYVMGKDSVGRRTPSALRHAIGYFQAAITIDPLYAPAYEGLSNAYALALFYRYEIGLDGYDIAARALDNADRAIELDRDYAYGYAARGYLVSRMSGPTREAARDFRRALQLAPNASQAVTWSGWVRAQIGGRRDDGLEATLRGAELNPYAPFAHLSAAYSAFELDSNRLAIAETRRTLELEPAIVTASALLGRALLLDGRATECVELELGPHEGVRAACLHELGRDTEARAIADSIARFVLNTPHLDTTYTAVIRAEDLACYYARVGDHQSTLHWLEKAFELSPIGVDQRVLGSRLFDSLRADDELWKEVERITEQIWPEVVRRADRIR